MLIRIQNQISLFHFSILPIFIAMLVKGRKREKIEKLLKSIFSRHDVVASILSSPDDDVDNMLMDEHFRMYENRTMK
jgi:hypothetical protein